MITGYTSGVWLGVSDIKKEGQFLSLSDARKPRYSNWLGGEPNNAQNEDCVIYSTSKDGWNDWFCTEKAHFVCEK